MSEDKSDKGPIADTPQLPRPVALPVLVLLLLTVVTQLGSLPYIMGRAKQVPGATLHSPNVLASLAIDF